MDINAVQAAKACLARAEAALASMESANTLEALEAGWTDLLVMTNRVYAKLEQGAKHRTKSKAWFDMKKHERKKDPLLKYIKNARDVDEHGLARVTERDPARTITAFGHIEAVDGHSIRLTPRSVSQPPKLTVGSSPERVRLIVVVNRGVKYEPPDDTTPVSVAKKAIEHLHSIVAEAERLEDHTSAS